MNEELTLLSSVQDQAGQMRRRGVNHCEVRGGGVLLVTKMEASVEIFMFWPTRAGDTLNRQIETLPGRGLELEKN